MGASATVFVERLPLHKSFVSTGQPLFSSEHGADVSSGHAYEHLDAAGDTGPVAEWRGAKSNIPRSSFTTGNLWTLMTVHSLGWLGISQSRT